ncbi:hypothetical protein B0T21DRAFT_292257 [Apiosordaria backusii]|uniref:MARVEL domain-containing protein n=1 Tax=Apiosordaria backusii TaxID=314023 RepID=A0AA40B7Y1_9PEZI|nr:hypothetical protein B0T21DRAFT_292257 [Apiosordaria backusii]
MATPQRKPGREHIPLMPTGFIALRIIQLVVAVIVLALVSYSIHFLAWDGNAFMLAVAIMTIISSIYHLIAWFGVPEAYNYWAILGLDITLIVLWLAAFAVVAARIAPWMEYYGAYLYSLSTYETAWWTGLAASSGLGGWREHNSALHIVSLVIHSIRLHRHRKEGGHCTPGVPFGPKPTTGTMQVPQGQQVVYAVPMVQGVVMPQQQQQQVYQQPQQQQMYQQPQAQGERPQGPPVYQQQPVQGLVYQQQQPPQQVYAPQPQQPQQVVYQQQQ